MASAYDTLDHVNTDNAKTIADVYKLILGKAMAAEDLCGVVCTGPLNQSQSQSGDWGRHPLTFDGHAEVWHVRCTTPGRMGEPLMPYEVRRIAVLLRESKDSKESVVTTIKLWRLAGSTEKLARASKDKRQRERGRCTSGQVGVSTHGINLFERRATPSSARRAEWVGQGSGFHAPTAAREAAWNQPFRQGNSLTAVGKCATALA